MKKIALLFTALTIACSAASAADHQRKSYVDKNGRYVAPSTATNPNNTETDNYSSKGNTNPYTGKQGTKTPKK